MNDVLKRGIRVYVGGEELGMMGNYQREILAFALRETFRELENWINRMFNETMWEKSPWGDLG